jgi:hypothetical protein
VKVPRLKWRLICMSMNVLKFYSHFILKCHSVYIHNLKLRDLNKYVRHLLVYVLGTSGLGLIFLGLGWVKATFFGLGLFET